MLRESSRALTRSLSALASGQRQNLSQAEQSVLVNLRSKINSFVKASMNINQGASLLEVAGSGLSSQIEMAQRMRELAVQASSGTLSSADREKINQEMQSLIEEFNRVATETDFSGQKPLDGSLSSVQLQVGANSSDQFVFDLESSRFGDLAKKTVGSGTFQSAQTYTTGDGPSESAVGDFDGDGDLDLAVSDSGTSDTISVYLNSGGGVFAARVTYAANTSINDLETADVNGDGILDLVGAQSGSVEVYLGRGDGSFDNRRTYSTGAAFVGATGRAMGLADFDGDGDVDLILPSGGATSVHIHWNDGDGNFSQSTTRAFSGSAQAIYGLELGDFNNDGLTDVLSIALNGDWQLNLQGDQGQFSTGSSGTIGSIPSFASAMGDFNGDGNLDFAVNVAATNMLLPYFGNGTGGFTSGTSVSIGSASYMRAGDINGDGYDDIIINNASIGILTSNGAGGFTQSTAGGTGGATPLIEIQDFTGDGVRDLLLGANTSDLFTLRVGNTRSVSAISDFHLDSDEDARELIPILDDLIENLVQKQSSLGVSLNSLMNIQNANDRIRLSFADAYDQMANVDMALETSELARLQIMQQAQIAALAQANSSAQAVLELLRFR